MLRREKLMKKAVNLCIAIIILMLVFSGGDTQRNSAEDLSIPAGVGFDIEKKGQEDLLYKISISSYVFEQKKTMSRVTSSEERSIGQTRNSRQAKLSKKFLIGLEKVDLISENQATNGIRNILDILFINPSANDNAMVAVCGGEAKTILEYPMKGYPSSSDYIEGMIKNSKNASFFTDNYKIIDVFVRLDSEGRNFTLPYLILTKEGPKIDGLALFKDDKMIGKMGMQEAKILNMLSESSGKGIIAVQNSTEEYIEFYGKPKRKVKCVRENDKYRFDISVKLNGELITNELNKKVSQDEEEKRKIEKEMSQKVEEECNKVIKIMKDEYKTDFLELGRVGAAKYGKDTGIDWNKVVAGSDIEVKVDVKIGKQGRGDY
jgi:Ger(x)C family germination protein